MTREFWRRSLYKEVNINMLIIITKRACKQSVEPYLLNHLVRYCIDNRFLSGDHKDADSKIVKNTLNLSFH